MTHDCRVTVILVLIWTLTPPDLTFTAQGSPLDPWTVLGFYADGPRIYKLVSKQRWSPTVNRLHKLINSF